MMCFVLSAAVPLCTLYRRPTLLPYYYTRSRWKIDVRVQHGTRAG